MLMIRIRRLDHDSSAMMDPLDLKVNALRAPKYMCKCTV